MGPRLGLRQARQALMRSSRDILRAKQAVKEIAREKWGHDWEHSKHGRELYKLCVAPNKDRLRAHKELKKAGSSILVQARTGKIGLNDYLYRINKADSPDCPNCVGTRETVRHVLTDCPRYDGLRAQHLRQASMRSSRDILMDPQLSKYTTKFLLQTGRLGQFSQVEETTLPVAIEAA